jgi:hypothetical protein
MIGRTRRRRRTEERREKGTEKNHVVRENKCETARGPIPPAGEFFYFFEIKSVPPPSQMCFQLSIASDI